MAELGQRTTLRIMVDADEGPKKELFGFMARSGHLAKGRGRPPKWPLRPIPSAELLKLSVVHNHIKHNHL
jgi:hypothetical protein